jgi:hypothetical protein
VRLLTDLDAFFTEHGRCGDLDAGVEGEVVWIACDCGARMVHPADGGDGAAGRGSQRDVEPDASAGPR